MRIHREGKKILLNTLFILVLFNVGCIIVSRILKGNMLFSFICIGVLLASSMLYAWFLYFFRNPHREIIPQKATCLLSPADGKVVDIKEVMEDEYFKDERLQISIFMSPFDVHVNRSPIEGILSYFKYHAGKYLVAFHPKSSTKNERTTAVVKRADGQEILFRQIAGFVARRIVFYPEVGDTLKQGQEIGFIKFGSRLDLFLPIKTKLQVKNGHLVKAGITQIADIPLIDI